MLSNLEQSAKSQRETNLKTGSVRDIDAMASNNSDSHILSPEAEAFEIERQKQHVLTLLNDLWDEASDDGISSDLLAHAALFQSLTSFVVAYGEETVADMLKNITDRVLAGDYSLDRTLQ